MADTYKVNPFTGNFDLTFNLGADSIKASNIDWGTGADQVNASDVPFTPVGDIVATDVQAAIAEVDTDKQPVDRICAKFIVSASGDTSGDYQCDGTSDQVEINAAITAALAAGGGIIHLKEGTYSIDGSINIDGDDIVFQGEGFATIIDSSSDITMINVGNGSTARNHIVIRDIKIDGNNAQANNKIGIYYNKVYYSLIENIDIGYCATNIYLNLCNYNKVAYCNSYDTNHNNCITVDDSNYVVVLGNYCDDPANHGIYFDNSNYCNAIANQIRDAASNGIYLFNSCDNCVISNNLIITTTATAISLWHTSTGPDNCVISNNTVLTAVRGIWIAAASCDNTMIIGNSTTSCSTADIADSGTGTIQSFHSPMQSFTMKTFNQSGTPNTTDIPSGRAAMWTDTDDSKCYLCYNHGGTVKTVELT